VDFLERKTQAALIEAKKPFSWSPLLFVFWLRYPLIFSPLKLATNYAKRACRSSVNSIKIFFWRGIRLQLEDFQDYEAIAKRINKIRIDLRMTQGGFAEKLNITQTVVSQIETRKIKPSIKFLAALSIYTNISVDFILTGQEFTAIPNLENRKEEFLVKEKEVEIIAEVAARVAAETVIAILDESYISKKKRWA